VKTTTNHGADVPMPEKCCGEGEGCTSPTCTGTVRVQFVGESSVMLEIAEERKRQLEKWGNDFDDANTEQDWAGFVMHYTAVGITSRLGAAPGRPFREAMLKVATLAVAAIEAHDRRQRA
jgi:hypothetical protein